jgi:threonine dehydrogenase-like Zn-dependent dehydrogenase
MRAVVFHDIGDIRLEEVPNPKLKEPTDAIVRLTASAICGTDLHFIRGTLPGMKKGQILGHEGVGVVEEVGKEVRNFRPGDRVVVPSTIGCGNCVYCRGGYFAMCDNANPESPGETAYYGGPKEAGGFGGMQAEFVRVPFASVNLYGLPDEISDDDAILLSDIFPTGYMAAELAGIKPGNTVAVFGCGPVGQFAIASAKLLRAGRIFAIDTVPSRLDMARAQGAEAIDFNKEDPIKAIKALTEDIGVDRAIDCVGVDADHPHRGKGAAAARKQEPEFAEEREKIAPKTHEDGDNWHPGDAPSQVLAWAVEALAKAGTLSIVGVYSGESKVFPIGEAMAKNLTIKMGNCNHRKYIPYLIQLVVSGAAKPSHVLTQQEPLTSAIEAYKQFDLRQPGWIKVKLEPQSGEETEEAA